MTEIMEITLEELKNKDLSEILDKIVPKMISNIRAYPCKKHKYVISYPISDQVFDVNIALTYGVDCE